MFLPLVPSSLNRAILAAFLFIAAVLPSQAQQFGDFTYTATATEVTIFGYTGAGGMVTIPSSIASLPVTSIGDQAFRNFASVTSVTIPNSVTSIGADAFSGCTGLTSVTIPNSVTSIGGTAFYECRGLTSVAIPNSVTSIGSGAFNECRGLTSVAIPNSVTSIGSGAFSGCTGLTSVTIPNSVTIIEGWTFAGCSGLGSVTIPNSVTSIGNFAFTQCSGLASPTIPSSVTSIGHGAFSQCFALTSFTIPSSVTSIEGETFSNCTSLNSVYFQGNAPTVSGDWQFVPATVFYFFGTTGWRTTFAGRPTLQLSVSINSHPVSVTTLQGTSARFTVSALGSTGYQWQKNDVNIPLETSATLILPNVQAADMASYTVLIFNPAGNVTSNAATLTVLPDSDRDGLSDAEEATYGTNPNSSDSDGDGLTDLAEIQINLSNALVKDTDGDGFEDGFEVSTGFNPAQAISSPDSVSTIGNAVGFRFNAGLGISYRIEDSSDLQNWTTLETPIIGAGGVVTRFYFTEGQPKRYFRVRKN